MPRLLTAIVIPALVACVPAGAPHPAPPGAAPVHAADTLSHGVIAVRLHDPAGPWAVHAIRIAAGACGVEVRSMKAGDALVGLERTSALAASLADRTRRPALAAVNADFFSYDPPGVPAGLQVQGGELVAPPSARPAFAIMMGGGFFIGHTRLQGGLLLPDGTTLSLDAVNRPADGDAARDGLVLFNRFVPTGVTEPTPGTVWMRPLDSPSATGDTLRGVVVTMDTAAAPDAGATARLVPATPAMLRGLATGDTLRWWTALDGPPRHVVEAVAGIPALVRDGRNVVGDARLTPAFRDQRHPRTAVGWTHDGTLILAVVDGRQPGYSDGMSLDELAELMLGFGAVEALNLDGGGSTTLVVRGETANRPSDPRGERPVANALIVLGPAPGHGDCASSDR